jgi:hypothetical protein
LPLEIYYLSSATILEMPSKQLAQRLLAQIDQYKNRNRQMVSFMIWRTGSSVFSNGTVRDAINDGKTSTTSN